MAISQLDYEQSTPNLTSLVTVLTHTPDISNPIECSATIKLTGLDGAGGNFQIVITIGGFTSQPSPIIYPFGAEVNSIIDIPVFKVPANHEVIIKALSPNAGDNAGVTVDAYLYNVKAAPTKAEIQAEMEENGASLLDTIRDAVESGTYGLSALKTIIDELTSQGDTNETKLDTIDGIVDLVLEETGTTLPDTLSTISGYIDAEIGTIITHLTDIKGSGWTDETLKSIIEQIETISVDVGGTNIEGSLDLQDVLRILLSKAAGICIGGGTSTITFKSQNLSKNRIIMAVDNNGNRSSVTLDAT